MDENANDMGMGISGAVPAFQDASLQDLKSAGHAPGEVDVLVVGAGIAGLTTAYCLAREGREVCVIDARPLGSGETGRSTAHLASALDDGFQRLERAHGEDGLRLAVESHAQAIDWIERICAQESIECGFERLAGWLFLDPERSPRFLERELDAARRAGLDVEEMDTLPIPTLAPGPALRFARQGQLDPARYLAGLARAAMERGVRIHIGLRAERFEGGETCKVGLADGSEIRASAVVVATNTPVNERVRLHTKQTAYRSYAVALEVERDVVPKALFWDTAEPYHYVRLAGLDPRSPMDLLIVGGEDHRTGTDDDPEARWEALVDWARPRFPAAGPVRHRWSGQILEPADGLAFIGHSPDGEENIFVASGDSGHGMTHGTIAGTLLSSLIQGRDDPRAALYDPQRWSLRGLPTWVKENLETAGHYLEWAALPPAQDEVELAPGEGMIVRRGMKRLAIACDDGGDYHVLSAVCPHLGGLVHWNAAERSWDCPCHGSRFDACGALLNGPASRGLEHVDPADAPMLITRRPRTEEVEARAGLDVEPTDEEERSSFGGHRSDVAGLSERSRAHEEYAQTAHEPTTAPRPTIERPGIIPFPGVTRSSLDEPEQTRLRPTIEPPRAPAPFEGQLPSSGRDALPSFGRHEHYEPQGTFEAQTPPAAARAEEGRGEPREAPPSATFPFQGALPTFARRDDPDQGRTPVTADQASLEDTDRFEAPSFSFVEDVEEEVAISETADFELRSLRPSEASDDEWPAIEPQDMPADIASEMPTYESLETAEREITSASTTPGGERDVRPLAGLADDEAAAHVFDEAPGMMSGVRGAPTATNDAEAYDSGPQTADVTGARSLESATADSGPVDLLVQPPAPASAEEPNTGAPIEEQVPAGQAEYDEYDEEDITTHPSRSRRRKP